MPAEPTPDLFESYYDEKLWSLLPEIYRAEDSPNFDETGSLREMVERIGAQAAVVRRSIDRLWEDEFIETCDDYLIPYLGDLLATNLVAGLAARGQRLDVAKTIYYRRRAGTPAILEEVATDITGWQARVVEEFRRLSRTRHNFDTPVGQDNDSLTLLQAEGLVGAWTRTRAGGTADLRNAYGASRAQTPFDEFFHTADFRRGRGLTGWHTIPRLGVFLYRLYSFAVGPVTPVADANCPNKFTFDPTGREIPLFSPAVRSLGDQWVSPEEWRMPGPIPDALLRDIPGTAPDRNRTTPPTAPPYRDKIYGDPPKAFGVYEQNGPFLDLVPPDTLRFETGRGLLYYPTGATPTPLPHYHYGFPSEIGAGPYDRRRRGPLSETVPTETFSTGGGDLPALPPTGTHTLTDDLTYGVAPANATVPGITELLLKTDNKRRPLVRLPNAAFAWTFTGADPAAKLTLEGVFVSGGQVVLDGEFDTVTLVCCTLDPGSRNDDGTVANAVDGRPLSPCRLVIAGKVRRLVLDRCIVGPVVVNLSAEAEHIAANDSILQGPPDTLYALLAAMSQVALSRCTVLGKIAADRFDASECILHDVVTVRNTQEGCVRFTAWATGSVLPRKYESVTIAPLAPLFHSRRFGSPLYCLLRPDADAALAQGAQDGSEMGAFAYEQVPIRLRGLFLKFEEFMPLGLAPAELGIRTT